MKSAVIIQDHLGLTHRIKAMRDAHPYVFAASPSDKPHSHALSIRPSDDWLPSDTSRSIGERCWHKADAMGLTAVLAHGVKADFYWFIESDVVASQDRWRKLFKDHYDNPADCLSSRIYERGSSRGMPWWDHPGTPSWANNYFIMSCYRLSHAALLASIASAVEMRECFADISVASVVKRAGFSHEMINARQTHWNGQTWKTREDKVLMDPDLINHPVKVNSYSPTHSRPP